MWANCIDCLCRAIATAWFDRARCKSANSWLDRYVMTSKWTQLQTRQDEELNTNACRQQQSRYSQQVLQPRRERRCARTKPDPSDEVGCLLCLFKSKMSWSSSAMCSCAERRQKQHCTLTSRSVGDQLAYLGPVSPASQVQHKVW